VAGVIEKFRGEVDKRFTVAAIGKLSEEHAQELQDTKLFR
jgi:hypothetical protein